MSLPKAALEQDYAAGAGEKHFLIVGISVPIIKMIGVTCYLDLDDYFGVTAEGRDGWVTLMLHFSVGAALTILPFDLGVYTLRLAEAPGGCPDPQLGASASLLRFSAGYGVTMAQVGEGGNTEFMAVDMNSVEFNIKATLAEMSTKPINLEIQRWVIDTALREAFLRVLPPGATVQTLDQEALAQAIYDAMMQILSDWAEDSLTLPSLAVPVRQATCSD